MALRGNVICICDVSPNFPIHFIIKNVFLSSIKKKHSILQFKKSFVLPRV